MDNKLNIYQRLHAVMQEVDRIKKDKKNTFHNYEYASENIIKDTLHGLLEKHGVLIIPTGTKDIQYSTVTTAKGNIENLYSAVFMYKFVDATTGESLEVEMPGQGQDSGDKGVYKAITGSLKYVLTTSFLIPTGDDPEGETAPQTRTYTPKTPVKQTPDESRGFNEGAEITVLAVKQGISKAGKPWEAVETSAGRLWNNSGLPMKEGDSYRVVIADESIKEAESLNELPF